MLRRRQVGTIVIPFDDGAFEVEFARRDGRPHVMLPIVTTKLMVLRDTPQYVAA